MPLPNLTHLQSRFAASLAATLFLILVYLVLSSPKFANALDVDSITRDSRKDLILPGTSDALDRVIFNSGDIGQTIVGVDGVSRAEDGITQRAPPGVFALPIDEAKPRNIKSGETQHWVFPIKEAKGSSSSTTSDISGNAGTQPGSGDIPPDEPGRKEGLAPRRLKTIYVTANTCLQPHLNATQDARDSGPPQLQMYISKSKSVLKPGPDSDKSDVTISKFHGGYGSATIDADDEVYIGISAPNNTRYDGHYNYEVAASIEGPFHTINSESPFLYFVDGDSEAALLQTGATTKTSPNDKTYKQWMELKNPPFTVFAHNMNNSAIVGLHKSYCGLSQNAQITQKSQNVEVGMTNRGMPSSPKEQFYVKALNDSSSYFGILGMEGTKTAPANEFLRKGKKLWAPMNFTTKADKNCAVVFDLGFCSEVAYAVPSHPDLKVSKLKEIYDDYAAKLYKNFARSLQQIPCNASATEQYSLATDCNQCASAYKQWLCAVTIPRCHDFSSRLPFLKPRNLGQSFVNGSKLPDDYGGQKRLMLNNSRNQMIDTEIKPGPYKEILPCQDLCYELVQSCPAALGFGCPENRWLNESYGARSMDGDITCSYLGAAYFLNAAWRIGDGVNFSMAIILAFWSLVWRVIF